MAESGNMTRPLAAFASALCLLLGACATVTATNLCLPSEFFAWLERRRTSTTKPITT